MKRNREQKKHQTKNQTRNPKRIICINLNLNLNSQLSALNLHRKHAYRSEAPWATSSRPYFWRHYGSFNSASGGTACRWSTLRLCRYWAASGSRRPSPRSRPLESCGPWGFTPTLSVAGGRRWMKPPTTFVRAPKTLSGIIGRR